MPGPALQRTVPAHLAACALTIALSALPGCREQHDKRFDTPAATIDALFRSYGIAELSEAEVRARLQARERFELRDPRLHRECFADWRGEQDQGLAGYVFGRLAAAKDHLRIDVEGDLAQITPGIEGAAQEATVLVRQDGAWKIALRQSVPEEVRQQLYQVYRRARLRERKAADLTP